MFRARVMIKVVIVFTLFTSCVSSHLSTGVPSYLSNYEREFRDDPRSAALRWYTDAKYGLFIHYGLCSLLGKNGWVMRNERIPLADYILLIDQFTAENFDADAIVELAVAGGMKYIVFTAKHHEGFCHWATDETDFNVIHTPAKRDLVAELATACNKMGIGLFLYYSYAADWHHPYFPDQDQFVLWRDRTEDPSDMYKWNENGDTAVYIEYVHSQIRELLTNYGPIAGIWLDPIVPYYGRRDLFPVKELYDLIREIQPQCLISFKQGAIGSEDIVVAEWAWQAVNSRHLTDEQNKYASDIWDAKANKPGEISMALASYFYIPDLPHGDADFLWGHLEAAVSRNVNLLVGTGPIGDGSLQQEDVITLKEVGKRIKEFGFPANEGEIKEPPGRPD